MKTLTVFHDPECGLCRQFRLWMEAQPKYVPVRFLAFNAPAAVDLFPDLPKIGADTDVVVLADDGRWWQGPAAWLTCLWITHAYRSWSHRLASPALLPMVRKAVHLLSENRLNLSRLLHLRSEADLIDGLNREPSPTCNGSACASPTSEKS